MLSCRIPFRSFPHGKNAVAIAPIVLAAIGFAMAFVKGSVLGMCLGLVVVIVMSLATIKPMPQNAITMVAIASLAIAGFHVVEMRFLFKMANSALVKNMCPIALSMKEQSEDLYNRMYSEYSSICGMGYKLTMIGHALAVVIWIACGVLIFLVPPAVDRMEAKIGVQDLGEPVTDFQKQTDNNSKVVEGEIA